ncbi:hypothetical protein MKW98_013725 [Papaver atlanticum]|uniref:Uncharacterized protein n=1 Tax=Papaver atlanticum TaxID=357466 RepID=A0AAD4SEX6_9MAGN|nr:hypothetical protein MKW98_013725 [Papaver atlanticum]
MDKTMEITHHPEAHVKIFPLFSIQFQKDFRTVRKMPLRDFCLIVPPLVIYSLDFKINGKANEEVTEQEKALAGLHWFSNMSEHLDQQLLSLEESKDTEQRHSAIAISGGRKIV